jgi:elongation factor G
MWPLLEISIAPKTAADKDKLGPALRELAQADPTFGVATDFESGQTILQGVSEEQFEAKLDVLIRSLRLQILVGAPQVAYRESLGKKTEIDHTYKEVTGGSGQFARIKIVFEPGEPGSDFQFESKVVGGSVPKEFIPGVEKGLESAKENGLLAGFPVIDVKATLIDGAYHDVDSSVMAFEIAARAAFRELREKGAPKLLEPIMKVEVVTPDEYMGDVIGDLSSRRAHIEGAEARQGAHLVTALAPLANMFSYARSLSVLSRGQARFSMKYDHYAPVMQQPEDPDPRFPPAMAMRA